MFDSLSSKLESAFKRLRGKGKITEADLDEGLKEIRLALLEADVNFKVVKDFCDNVKTKALGKEVNKSLTPGQAVIKCVHEELIHAMGEHSPLNLKHAPPVVIMLVGLQGAGKTTTCGKLAKHLKEERKRNPVMVSIDVYRPAAIEQLKTVGNNLGVEVFPSGAEENPLDIAQRALKYCQNTGKDTLIIDTAGRLQIDNTLMNELVDIVENIEPHEILLVADAMTGQEAVNVAKGFDERLDVDGIVLTKLDGDARGGAALSMKAVTQKPIKFIGVGEKSEALEPFHPDRMASRILGMGDMLTLIEKASKQFDAEEAQRLTKKLKKNEFTLEDFHSQLQNVKKMGSMGSIIKMLPGMDGALKGFDDSLADDALKRIEAIILSMTPKERRDHTLLNGSRRKRIALGSGTSVEEVNKLLEQFSGMRKFMTKFSKMSPNSMKSMASLQGLMGAGPKGAKLPRSFR